MIERMESREIETILPHRYPFLLVDRVLELEPGKRIVAIKNVSRNEPFFQGHFPGYPIMPGVLIIEAMAQAAGILAYRSSQEAAGKLVYFLGIERARFRRPVVPGDQLRLELEVAHRRPPNWRMHGRALVGDQVVCEAELSAMVGVAEERGTSGGHSPDRGRSPQG